MLARYLLVLCLVLMGSLTCSPVVLAEDVRPAAPQLPENSEPDNAVDVLFLGGKVPVFLRLHLTTDGRSFRAPWREFIAWMFQELDYNGDGVLSGTEWDRVPSADLLMEGNPHGVAQGASSVRVNFDTAPTDGLVTLEEFHATLTAFGARPLSLAAQSPPARSFLFRAPPIGQSPSDPLFENLDADHDRQLSRAELAAARDSLAQFDADEDGSLTYVELRSDTLTPGLGLPVVNSQTESDQRSRPTQFVELPRDQPTDRLVRQLLDAYDRPTPGAEGNATIIGDDCLTLEEFPLAKDTFEALDTDRDGRLDFDELRGIVRNPRPALIVEVRVGMRAAGLPAVEVRRVEQNAPLTFQSAELEATRVLLAGTQLEFSSDASDETKYLEQFRQNFLAADSDNNNYLDRAESRRTFFSQSFEVIDQDGDDKLFEPELMAFVNRHLRSANARCLMTIADDGRSLFDVLDANRDGRLSPRELLTAAARSVGWDADQDGHLTNAEIPAHLRIRFGRGLPNIPGLPQDTVRQSAAKASMSVGPDWFRRMDKNKDGDVTRREFLGSRAAFERVDLNRDGIIDETEASQASGSSQQPSAVD